MKARNPVVGRFIVAAMSPSSLSFGFQVGGEDTAATVRPNCTSTRNRGWWISENRVGLPREDVMAEVEEPREEPLYCPKCDREAPDPLVCGDCAAVICRVCGTPLEKVDELGIG